MELNHEHCYAIVKSRDERYDGRFFTGVLTTGIYCRPICPAPRPKAENVRFFVSAAAAEEAGLRPCLRCRPESSPGTPDWVGTSATVNRALRLIGEGVMDEHDLPELASRLHVGTRQLHRLFVQHVGASPVTVAQNRRVLFAKKLITETTLPMTEIAFSAGFSSIRRFNDVMQKVYGRSPTTLRKEGTRPRPQAELQLKLAYRPPYDWQAILQFLGARAIPGVEWVDGDQYRRTVKMGEAVGTILVAHEAAKHNLLLTISPNLSRSLIHIVDRVRHLFDLRADPMVIGEHLAQDARLAPLVARRPGLRVPGAWDGFEVAVRAILGQQVSVKGATTLSGRLVAACGTLLEGSDPHLTHLFPTPERLSEADLSGLGLTGQRIVAIQALARAVHEGELVLGTAVSLDDLIAQLVPLPGIGDWTAHYMAMRVFGEPDAFPAGDLVLRKAVGDGTAVTAKQLQQMAEAWRPWRAYAAMQLWAGSLEVIQ
ncbi:MAG: DNA-3-methyladenine glycosylase 2 family protein [Ardenticatenaceae bacterium]|nr:DNA-3-methyladenine glycosylase 2 family protein [Ardenticatenaceae bacterium]